ncbi:hypothetical protein Gekk315_00063 [Aeromonas phage Gekk3-15]
MARRPVVIYPTTEGHASVVNVARLVRSQPPAKLLANLILRLSITDKELLALCEVLPPDTDRDTLDGVQEEAWPKRNNLGAFEQKEFDNGGADYRKIILHDW